MSGQQVGDDLDALLGRAIRKANETAVGLLGREDQLAEVVIDRDQDAVIVERATEQRGVAGAEGC